MDAWYRWPPSYIMCLDQKTWNHPQYQGPNILRWKTLALIALPIKSYVKLPPTTATSTHPHCCQQINCAFHTFKQRGGDFIQIPVRNLFFLLCSQTLLWYITYFKNLSQTLFKLALYFAYIGYHTEGECSSNPPPIRRMVCYMSVLIIGPFFSSLFIKKIIYLCLGPFLNSLLLNGEENSINHQDQKMKPIQ